MSGKARRAVVSIAGAPGTGKSKLALAIRQALGDDVAARVPMDWLIVPRDIPMDDWLQRPLAYDHDAVRAILDAPVGTQMHTPPFDFITFQRSAISGDINLVPIRPVMLLDGMEPWPDADRRSAPAYRRARCSMEEPGDRSLGSSGNLPPPFRGARSHL